MAAATDLRVVGLDEERTTRADPAEGLFDVHLVLSDDPPVGWAVIALSHLAPRGVAGRRAWTQGRYVVVRCTVDEVERVVAALAPVLEAANREYGGWAAARDRAERAGAAFDRRELEKLRAVKARLGLGGAAAVDVSPGRRTLEADLHRCQRCGGPRLAHILAHCSDMCSVDLGGRHEHGYVPRDLGVGGGDDVQMAYCLDCGQIQGRFPLPPAEIEAAPARTRRPA